MSEPTAPDALARMREAPACAAHFAGPRFGGGTREDSGKALVHASFCPPCCHMVADTFAELHDLTREDREAIEGEADVPAWNRVVADLRREVLSLGAEAYRLRAWLERMRALDDPPSWVAAMARDALAGKEPP